jgi:molybdopterin/thiamine biosynthesis adenylyltransferase
MQMSGRFDRQIIRFGEEGQARITASRVGIVGLGGLGSHVAQQLVYLGVGHLTLIDPDPVEASNLNRLVGAAAEDARIARLKVDVVERVAQSVDPEIEITKIPASITSDAAVNGLQNVDYIVGCLDHDGPRLLVTVVSSTYDKPYMDLATDISDEDAWFGGRVIFAGDGEGCLVCFNQLDQRDIRLWMSNEAELAEEDRIYGQSRVGPSPSVVALNGVVASAGVMELIAAMTGIRPINRHLEYRADGKLVIDRSTPSADCFYCKALRTSRDPDALSRMRRAIPPGR